MSIRHHSSSKQSKPSKWVELITDSFGFIANKNTEPIQVKRFTWKNSNRIQVQAITFGATITSVRYPSKKGIVEDVALGFDDLQSYVDQQKYSFGSTIGRHANYIKNASFSLMRRDWLLTPNMGKHHYNGGNKGLSQVVWNHHVTGNKVTMSYMSPDGEEGYPGDLLIIASFELTSLNELRIEYKAMCTKPTIVNIANHIYFNLAGHAAGEKELGKHTLMLNADCHTVTGKDMLPTGDIQSVLNTIYDFQSPTKLGPLLDKVDGYNNNFCINRGAEQGLNFIARLFHPPSGRIMELYSNQFGVNFDTANNLPISCEPEETLSYKTAKCPYLKTGVTTFDLLDEIHNKLVEIRLEDPMNDYDDLISLLQDMMKKQGTVYRNAVNPEGGTYVKRSSVTIESLPVLQLTQLQQKYIERIQKALDAVKESDQLEPLKSVLKDVIHNNHLFQESCIAFERRRKEEHGKIVRGKKSTKYCKHGAVALQSQNYPDSINNSKFPSCVLKPGQTYDHVIVYKFWIKTDQSGVAGVL